MKKYIQLTLALCAILFIITSCSHVHNFGEWTVTKRPTCTEAGEQERVCSCGERQTQAIASTGHSFGEWKTIKNPTATEPGERERVCECGDRQVQSIPALQGEATTDLLEQTTKPEATTAPELTTAPEMTTVSDVTTEQAHVHSFASVWSKSTSQHWHECSCGEKKDVVVHNFGTWIVTKEATCTSLGSKMHACTVCGYDETVAIDKLAHTPVVDVAVAPTCTDPGKTAGSHCSVCQIVLTTQQTISAAGHSFGSWSVTKTAGCTSKGQENRICSVCNASEARDIDALGHNYVDTVISPTVSNYGYTKHICLRCNDSYIDSIVEATGSRGLRFSAPISDAAVGHYLVAGIGSCTDSDLYIPSTYNGKPVRGIGDDALSGCSGIINVYIPESFTSIGKGAFKNCKNLKSAVIPNGIRSIGIGVFEGCDSLEEITMPAFGDSLWLGKLFGATNELEWEKVPASLKSIILTGNFSGDASTGSFSHCTSLTSITILGNVTRITDGAFYQCTSLTSVILPDTVTEIGYESFYECKALSSITIPQSVTNIGNNAFFSCTGLTSIVIPQSVTNIGNYAFLSCTGLTSIVIPKSVTNIGNYAFLRCTGLTSIVIPQSVTYIGVNAFEGCKKLTSITYNGFKAQWQMILSKNRKIFGSRNPIIHCFDGDCFANG